MLHSKKHTLCLFSFCPEQSQIKQHLLYWLGLLLCPHHDSQHGCVRTDTFDCRHVRNTPAVEILFTVLISSRIQYASTIDCRDWISPLAIEIVQQNSEESIVLPLAYALKSPVQHTDIQRVHPYCHCQSFWNSMNSSVPIADRTSRLEKGFK